MYDSNGFGKGTLFDWIPLSNGSAYNNKDGVTVRGADFKSFIGFLLANENNVASIVNIDDIIFQRLKWLIKC